MRAAWPSLLLVLAAPAGAQEVAECRGAPDVSLLVEPWEETSRSLGARAIRVALLERVPGREGQGLLVLTLPPAALDAGAGPRRCRVVTEGAVGFAGLDVAALSVEEDPEAATLTARLPVLRFVPESTKLEEGVLRLTFGVGDDSLLAAMEAPPSAP